MTLTKSQYGYEMLKNNGDYFTISLDGKHSQYCGKRNINQLSGNKVHGIPNLIKGIVFKLQKNEN